MFQSGFNVSTNETVSVIAGVAFERKTNDNWQTAVDQIN